MAVSHRILEGDRIYFGTAAHSNPITAATKAIHELHQIMTRESASESQNYKSVELSNERELAKWVESQHIIDHPHLAPTESTTYMPNRYRDFSCDDFLNRIEHIDRILAEHNLKAYYLDLSRLSLAFHTVKVVIPGLRHFWRRLSPGRLYDVPVKMGLRRQPLKESDMNPTPYFL